MVSEPDNYDAMFSDIEDVDGASVAGTDEDEQDVTITINSPPSGAKSLASSSSSSRSMHEIPPAPQPEIKRSIPIPTLKSRLSMKGTLTERSTNVLAGRPTRRTRR